MKKLLVVVVVLFTYAATQSAKLDTKESDVLKVIGEKLEKRELDKDPCGGGTPFFVCDCSTQSNTTCHVISMFFPSFNLSTSLPLELAKLPHLLHVNFDLNYLSGTIPSEWAAMSLTDISLVGNLLSGPFPIVLTKMHTLQYLNIDGNRFSGLIPPELGNLKNLTHLDLSSNDFTGQLPVTLAKLTNLFTVRISDNNFTGKIPSFISEWTQIRNLYIQGCSFEGPLPSSISNLEALQDLRISDLKGGASTIPSLEGIEGLKTLVLRDCLIHGTIPMDFSSMMDLSTLDLSFNNLSGSIPEYLFTREILHHVFLTTNNLTGPIPESAFSSDQELDLSYNHFTWNVSGPKRCEHTTINFMESFSVSSNETNNVPPCLRKDLPCTKPDNKKIYQLYINCGGKEIIINNAIKYEADLEKKGSSTYYNAGNWAFSSTGRFEYSLSDTKSILSNTSNLVNISTSDMRLFTTARTTAISLTYYGLCLLNGNYTVRLHFAEIVFTQYKSFNITRRRVFDVYVQGELKLKDFDIVKEAGGIGIAIIKSYAVTVRNNTLKIQLYWAGKGTSNVYYFENYGPIISAISVDPNFKPPNFGKNIDFPLIVVIVGVFTLFVIILILSRVGYFKGGKATYRGLRGVDLQTGVITLRQIQVATKNFDQSNKIGEGGFGAVYKGILSDGALIAVKQLSSKSKQGDREFLNEIALLSTLRHPNLVRLYGCCIEGNQLSLILEYMENGCLSRALSGIAKSKLTWPVRFRICLGIARGLAYLHDGSQMRIIHRDIKASNVLLDGDLNAKISDFGLAKLMDDGNTQVTDRVVGTIGYMAPEYLCCAYLTPQADIYSFGIVALDIVTGTRGIDYIPTEEYSCLLYKARVFQKTGRLLELVDADLGSYSSKEALIVLNVALLCTNDLHTLRPTISQTLNLLEGQTNIEDFQRDVNMSRMQPQDHGETSIMRDESSVTEWSITEIEESGITESM